MGAQEGIYFLGGGRGGQERTFVAGTEQEIKISGKNLPASQVFPSTKKILSGLYYCKGGGRKD